MRSLSFLISFSALAICAAFSVPSTASACGGFFCGQQPVDQQAERIVFAVDEEAGTTEMIVQIAYQGAAADFAWILPLGSVPDPDSLETFPQAALTALDANTSPRVWPDTDCFPVRELAGGGNPAPPSADDDVTVHLQEEVGPFAVVVVESEDPAALVAWLRDHDYRVTTPMEPYIADYAEAGLKFLALRLRQESKVGQIEPFRMVLPGTSPSVPLRMTALAAEPEMGVVVFLLGRGRYTSAGWPELEVDPADLIVDPFTYENNWTAAVAHTIDEAGGQGFVADMAESTESMVELLENTMPNDPDQAEAQRALLDLIRPHAYLTRLYARVSAEEMSSDPTFRRSDRGDVSRFKVAEGAMCEDLPDEFWAGTTWPPDVSGLEGFPGPCDFVTCGAGGQCVTVAGEGDAPAAACACVPGATARTTLAPDGRATVICQDRRMSFINPGDREAPGEAPLPDPCVGFDCGRGTCTAINMTPTCMCDEGFVAVGAIDEEGVRSTTCVEPIEPVDPAVYRRRLPELPDDMSVGVDVVVAPPAPRSGGLCAVSPARGSDAGALAVLSVFGMLLLTRRRRR